MTEGKGYKLDDQIGFKLRVANQKHLEIFAHEMPDLTPRQFAVLAKLTEVGPLSQITSVARWRWTPRPPKA